MIFKTLKLNILHYIILKMFKSVENSGQMNFLFTLNSKLHIRSVFVEYLSIRNLDFKSLAFIIDNFTLTNSQKDNDV